MIKSKRNKINTMKTHYIVFASLAILILWNMLLPGYIFALDRIPKPHMEAHPESSGAPFYALLALANIVMPSWLIQKILLFLVLFLSFTTMYALIPTKCTTPKYFGALLYTINPFVYERFLAGHINLLLAYSITPLAVIYILKFAKDPSKKNTIFTALIIALTGILNLHNLFLTLLIFAVIIAAKARKSHIMPVIKVIAILLLLNSFWLLQPQATSKIDTITQDDIGAFRSTRVMDFNTAFSLAGMHGFWRSSAQPPAYWPVVFIIILFLSVQGYVRTKNHAFALLWVISLIIAAGITTEYTKPLYLFLYENIFFFKGFREPQKFIGVVALVYAYLAAAGMERIKNRFVPLILLIIPFIYTPAMFFGFSGALPAQDYPGDYYETDEYLNTDTGDFMTLILPWHLYMDYSWNKNADKRLANTAQSFFTKPVISGDNMEVGGIYSSSNNPRSKYIESMLAQNTSQLGKLLIPLNVKYIILKKEVDYRGYLALLESQEDIILIKNTTNILLYKNTNPVYKIYQTDDMEDIAPLEYEKISAYRYKIAAPDKKYVVFTEPGNWRISASAPLKDQPVNVFEYRSGTEITKETTPLIAGCIISVATFICLLIALKRGA